MTSQAKQAAIHQVGRKRSQLRATGAGTCALKRRVSCAVSTTRASILTGRNATTCAGRVRATAPCRASVQTEAG
jgi:hypothetical protein